MKQVLFVVRRLFLDGHMSWAVLPLMVVAGVLPLVSLSGGFVVERSVFMGGAPPVGWTMEDGSCVSPEYSNRVVRIELAYGASISNETGTALLSAVDHATSNAAQIAALNTMTTSASFDFPESSDYRAFSIVPANGFLLTSFAATWLDTRLDVPTNIVVRNNTGSSFDISWDAVEGAVGYRVSVWTNVVVGASAGTEMWVETFAGMDASGSAALNPSRLEKADHGDEWKDAAFEKGYLLDNGGGIRIGQSEAGGWIAVPHTVSAGETALLVDACRYKNDDGQGLAVSAVSLAGETNLIQVVELDGLEVSTFDIALPADAVGKRLIFETVSLTGKKERRVAITRIAFVSGYSKGVEHPVYLRTVDVGEITAVSVAELPPMAVFVGVQALAAQGSDMSAVSPAIGVDLANPPPSPVLAVLGSVVAGVGYCEAFDAITNLPATSVWEDGVTVPYWQAQKGGNAIDTITTASGAVTGGRTGGLYAYHGTNRADSASYSLGAAANGSNRIAFGFAVTNDTEQILSGFGLSFTARQWSFTARRTAEQSLRFAHLTTNELVAVSATSGDWIDVEPLRFDAVFGLDAGGANVDAATGSVFANMSAELEGVDLPPGGVLLLRWTPDPVANGDVLGVDDVSLTCVSPGRGMVIHLVKTGR